jgi:hypothetical protein
MTDAAVIFFENALILLKESTEIRIIVVIRYQMLVDDLPFGLVLAFALFCPQFSHPPDTRSYGRVSGVGWQPDLTESRVLDIGWTPKFHRKSRVPGVGCSSGATPWSWGPFGFVSIMYPVEVSKIA